MTAAKQLLEQTLVQTLTKVEEDEFGLDGRTEFDDEGNGDVDDQQPQHDPP